MTSGNRIARDLFSIDAVRCSHSILPELNVSWVPLLARPVVPGREIPRNLELGKPAVAPGASLFSAA